MEITILGTTAMVPTKERAHTAIYVDIGKTALLFDCGENTQRQITLANLKAQKISAIFISHWHGDHVLGLPGLLQTLAAQSYGGQLKIFGPTSTKKRIDAMFEAFEFDNELSFSVHEITHSTQILDIDDVQVHSYFLNHSIECIGYTLQEKQKRKMDAKKLKDFGLSGPEVGSLQAGNPVTHKGKKIMPNNVSTLVEGRKIGFIFDTTLSEDLLKIAENADILVCESTYMHKLEDKAIEYKHLTATQAAQIASQADAKKLILTHFSPRYKQIEDLIREAQTIFPNTVGAHDLMKIKL